MTQMKSKFEEGRENGTINPEDAAFFDEFIAEYATLKRLAKGSIIKYKYVMGSFLTKITAEGYSIRTLDKKGALMLINWLQNSSWQEETRESYWDRFTRFYKWVAKQEGLTDTEAYTLLADPEEKYNYKIDANKVRKKGILTPEEVLALVHSENELRYKAFFAVLYESGMRSGEIFSLRVGDVKKNKNEYTVHMQKSKTHLRPIPIMEFAVPYLRKWLQYHPQKDDAKAPLWLNTINKPLNGTTANKRLRLLLRRTNIDTVRVTLHSFRHSRCTEMAAILNEFQLCKLFGWDIGSKMPRRYIRQQHIDVRRSIRAARGMIEEEKPKPPGKVCLSCEHQNAIQAKYCDNCQLPLSRERYEEIKQNMDNERLLRALVDEKWGDLIKAMRKEIKAQFR